MHYAQTTRDPLAHLSEQGIGFWQAAAAVAAERLMDRTKSGQPGVDTGGASGARGADLPGTEQSSPRQPSAVTTVSPAIQASISPQISPTMVQQQSSPGATVGASPVQYMPGGLQADTGVTPAGSYGMPGFPEVSPGVRPQQPYQFDPSTGYYMPSPMPAAFPGSQYMQPGGAGSPVSIGPARMTDIPWLPIALVGGGIAVAMLLRNRRRRT